MTLSISDIEIKKRMEKISFVYLMISLVCVLFGAVYEYFSHEVYSAYMIYAFAFPLAGGALPFSFISIYKSEYSPGRFSLNLYNSGIAALTAGSIIEGVLAIYGTTNGLTLIYWIAGWGLVAGGLLSYVASILTTKNKT